MRLILPILLLALAAPASARREPNADKALAGRIAGKPQSCITRMRGDDDTTTYDDGSILFRTGRGTWYLNRPPGCSELRSDRGFVSRTPTTALCRGDIITIIDPPAPMSFGSCALGDFVPYTRAAR